MTKVKSEGGGRDQANNRSAFPSVHAVKEELDM